MNGDGVKRHSLLTEMTVNEDNDVMAKNVLMKMIMILMVMIMM